MASGRPVLWTQSGELYRALCWEEPVLGIMLCFHSVEILNNFWTRVPIFSFCTWICKLYTGPGQQWLCCPNTPLPCAICPFPQDPREDGAVWEGHSSNSRLVQKTLRWKFIEENSKVPSFFNSGNIKYWLSGSFFFWEKKKHHNCIYKIFNLYCRYKMSNLYWLKKH